MISHVFVGIRDFERALAFYEGLMKELGFALRFADPGKQWAGGMQPGVARPPFLIGRPFDGEPAQAGNGQMIALLATIRDAVDRGHAKALTAGGADEGPPGLRPQYHANYYGAYFRDPDGNKLCVCCHHEEPRPTE